jgi:WD40 repeat protein
MAVAYSPDGERIATAGGDPATKRAELKIWNATTGQELLALEGHGDSLLTVAFSPNGQRLASGGRDGRLKVWNAITGQETLSVGEPGTWITGLAFQPDGSQLAVSTINQTILLYKLDK